MHLFERFKKYLNLGNIITSLIILDICLALFWDTNYYIKEGVLILYFFLYIYGTYQKKQYVEGARPHLIYFTTVNNRLYNIPQILEPLFYISIMSIYLYYEYGLDNYYISIYLPIGYSIVSIWNSSYGKLPSASLSIDKEEDTVECYDGVETYDIAIEEIQDITISPKSIILHTEQKKVNLIHLSLDEKEMRLVSNYCRSQLRTTPTVISKEELARLQ